MRVLVTGADGFVGSWLVPRLRAEGHAVVAAVRPVTIASARWPGTEPVPVVALELGDPASVAAVAATPVEAVIHLAAVASGGDARHDPGAAWSVNALGTASLAEELGRRASQGRQAPVMLLVSTAEVYGIGSATPRVESDPTRPVSAYAASKLAAEVAALEVHRRTGLRVIIARAFPHTGRGQDDRFVVPALARRLRIARRTGAPVIKVGNLEPVREFMHVSDVVEAYCRLLTGGRAGETYNVACGRGISVHELVERLIEVAGYRVIPETDPELVRPVDIPYLVGDATKLAKATGWAPRVTLEALLAEVMNAQAD